MFHFDGHTWSTTGFHSAEGGSISGPVDLHSVFALSSSHIFVAGQHFYQNSSPPPSTLDSSLLIHFDGIHWNDVLIPRKRMLETVWASSENDLWIGGMWGTLEHFDGSRWIVFPIDTSIAVRSVFGYSASEVYATFEQSMPGPSPFFNTMSYFVRLFPSSWAVIDSFSNSEPARFGLNLWGPNPNTTFSGDSYAFVRQSGSWMALLPLQGVAIMKIRGTRNEHLFAAGLHDHIYHFNGTDWYRYPQFSDASHNSSAVWCDENEVFILSTDGVRSFVYHGK